MDQRGKPKFKGLAGARQANLSPTFFQRFAQAFTGWLVTMHQEHLRGVKHLDPADQLALVRVGGKGIGTQAALHVHFFLA